MSKKSKIIVLSSMILLLAVTAVFNYVFSSGALAGDSIAAANYFTEYRSERDSSRNEEILQIDSVLTSAEKDSDSYASAVAMKLELTTVIEKELLLESLIKALGFDDAVVTIGVNSESVSVIIKDAELTQDEAVAVYTILVEEVSVGPQNVRIIPIS